MNVRKDGREKEGEKEEMEEIEEKEGEKEEMEEIEEKEEKLDDETLEALLCEQCEKHVRSNYRRSLGNEAGRRYKE